MFKSLIPWSKATDSDATGSDMTNEISRFRADFDNLIERLFSAEGDNPWSTGWGCEVKDGENEIVVSAEAPGFDPQEIDIQLSGNRLVMQAEHKSESGNGKVKRYGKFYRSITVPRGIEADKIDASYKNGVLEVHLPKGEEAKTKKIAVKAK